jgi:hypothetical protein
MAFQQGIESMEKFFLGAFLASKELNIVDEQGVYRAVEALEFIDRIMLQGLNHVRDEALRVQVDNLRRGFLLQHHVAHGVHQVGLAQTDTAVDKQRIISGPGIFSDLNGCRPRQLIGFTLNKGIKSEFGAQIGRDATAIPFTAETGGRWA